MAVADRDAIAAGTAEAVLIERAGRALAWTARCMLGGAYGRRVVVLAGKGNNGADGRVAARVLQGWGTGTDVVDAAGDLDRAAVIRSVDRADLVVDAMFGTGLRGGLDGDRAWCAELLAAREVPVLAADIPSGVAGATGAVDGSAVCATATLCFQALKPGLLFEPGRSYAGRFDVADLGIPFGAPTVHVPEAGDVALPPRAASAHKWSRAVLVVGGGRGMAGAPVLAARAAARAGAGMVVAALPADAVHAQPGSELVFRSLPTDDGSLAADGARLVLREVGRYGAVVIGPGLGRAAGSDALAARVVAECPVPVVVDADALNALADDPAPLAVRRAAGLPPAILTPHAGEHARLASRTGTTAASADRLAAARELAHALGAVVVLKGPGTVTAAPDGTAMISAVGGAELASAGTGDVLAGVIGACAAAGLDPFVASWSAVWLHGRAGEHTGLGDSTTASDVIAALPLAWADVP
jgi:NAD(P)H-hydrate epimerase